jgi:exopolyphosphatase / guanosine-5'-triphosphate,3'-diphosphate pyrophosphatase
MEPKQPRIIGCLDLGTNSVRLLVVLVKPNGSFFIMTQQKEVIRLGEGEFTENRITPEAIQRATNVIVRLIELAKSRGAEDIIAVATSAARDASNGEELCSQIEQISGVKIRIISGTEEARLIWLGISSGYDLRDEKALFIDIGGGSTEVIVGDQYEPVLLRSLKLGAIRTSGQYFPPSYESAVPENLIRDMRTFVDNQIVHVAKSIRSYKISRAFGSSGTIISLEAIAAAYKPLSGSHKSGVLTRDELDQVVKYLSGLSLKDRRSVTGLNSDRADIIIAGSVILHEILKTTGVKSIEISSRSLRDGLLLDYISRIPGFFSEDRIPVRENSVRSLGISCHIDEDHTDQITSLALDLYDTGVISGLFERSDEGRDMLYYAARLHDVGQFISFSNHHQHSFYLITEVPLPGFNQHEVLLIGLIAKYHRKKPPRSRDPSFRALSRNDKRMVRQLSLILRISEHLDRSHDRRVIKASFENSIPENEKSAYLDIFCNEDCSLERWAVEADKEIFFRTTGLLLKIKVIGSESEEDMG